MVIRVPEVLDALREVVDVVILDVPSFLSVHHGQGLAPLADLVLIVGERRLTTTDELRRTSAVLRRLGAPVVGMALDRLFGSTDDDEEDDEDDDEDVKMVRDVASGAEGERTGWRLAARRRRPGHGHRLEAVHRRWTMAPLGFEMPSEHRAVWDVPARPEA